jgi:hypothetical protein
VQVAQYRDARVCLMPVIPGGVDSFAMFIKEFTFGIEEMFVWN